MGLSETEREHLRCILQQYEEDPRVLEMDNYIQHGCVTTYQHCWNVARCTASSIRCWPAKMPSAALP